MNTLHLRFPNEATAAAALDSMADRGVTVDAIGPITGRVGWHVNMRGESANDGECLAAYVVHPASPVRVFA